MIPLLGNATSGIGRPLFDPIQRSDQPLRVRLQRCLWMAVWTTIYRCSPTPCRGFRRLLLRLFGAQLHPTASVHSTARIECPWNLVMGARSSVGEGSWIYALDKIVIEDRACVGQHVRLLTGSHDVADPHFALVTAPIGIGSGAWIAVGATILPGVRVGALAVVGAGSVVTRDVPEAMICAGNPCEPIRRRVFTDVERDGGI